LNEGKSLETKMFRGSLSPKGESDRVPNFPYITSPKSPPANFVSKPFPGLFTPDTGGAQD
jgi:hypothetical protein